MATTSKHLLIPLMSLLLLGVLFQTANALVDSAASRYLLLGPRSNQFAWSNERFYEETGDICIDDESRLCEDVGVPAGFLGRVVDFQTGQLTNIYQSPAGCFALTFADDEQIQLVQAVWITCAGDNTNTS